MHYLIGRDLDGDGRYEFIQDLNNMILTDDAHRALQLTRTQINQIDMAYLNAAGFYALEADRFRVSFMESLLLAAPLVMGFRPRVAPPPRRRRTPPPPPPRPPRRAPAPGRIAAGPGPMPPARPKAAARAAAPRVYGPTAGGATGSRSMGPGAGRAKGAGSLKKMGPGPGKGPGGRGPGPK